MNLRNLIANFSSPEAYLEALEEKAKSAGDKLLTIISMFDSLSDTVENLQYMRDEPIDYDLAKTFATDILTENGITDAAQTITVLGKTVSLHELLTEALVNTADDINLAGKAADLPVPGINYPLTLTNLGVNEDLSETFTAQIYDVGNDFQKQYQSIIALGAACGSLADRLKGNVEDIIGNFNDRLSDVFSNAHVDLSNTVSFYKQLLRTSTNATDFLNKIVESTSADRIEDTPPGSDFDMTQCPMGDYTGTSVLIPLSLDFSKPFEILHNVKKTAAWLAAQALKGIAAGIMWLGSKLVNIVAENTWNPVDIYPINKKGFGTVDKFQYQSAEQYETTSSLRYQDEGAAHAMENWITSHLNSWFSSASIFSERAYKFTACLGVTDVGGIYILQYKYIWIVKPRIINPLTLRGYFQNTGTRTVDEILEAAALAGDSLYDISDLSEDLIMEGLMTSIALDSQICSYLCSQAYGDASINKYTGTYYLFYLNATSPWTGQNVSNLDFACIASGYDDHAQSFENDPRQYVIDRISGMTSANYNTDYGYTDVSEAADYWLRTFLACIWSQEFETNVYAKDLFIPYSFENPTLHNPSYAIKTDSYNQAASMRFITFAIIIVTVIIASVVIGLKIRKYRREKFIRLTSTVGRLDNKMWNGGILDASEKRLYLKSQRKLSRLNLFSSSLLGGGANLNDINPSSSTTSGENEILARIG